MYGTISKAITWSESYGKGVGVVVDECPTGFPLTEADIRVYLDRGKPRQSKFTTARQGGNVVGILSGVFEGRTTGMPITLKVYDTGQCSHDYGSIMDVYRPEHAGYTFNCKYGFRDYRGDGCSLSRETIGRTAAEATVCRPLKSPGITMRAYTQSVGEVETNDQAFQLDEMWNSRLCMPDAGTTQKAQAYLEEMVTRRDPRGDVVEYVIQGVPVGVGESVFEKLDANLVKTILSIGAVKRFEVGDGFEAARALGSSNNDGFIINRGGKEDGKEDKKGDDGGNGRRAG